MKTGSGATAAAGFRAWCARNALGVARTLRLRLASDPSEAKRLRNELHRWLLGAGINSSTGAEIVLAVNEAFINAVEHPRDRRSGEIVISGRIGECEVAVCVRDDGLWEEEMDLGRDHFGQSVMEALMSSVRVERGESGTQVVLVQQLPST
jgi:anti-sigma regulatory factor (Ser/Thr protein kinase)